MRKSRPLHVPEGTLYRVSEPDHDPTNGHAWVTLFAGRVPLAVRCDRCGQLPSELLTVNGAPLPWCEPAEFDRGTWRSGVTHATYHPFPPRHASD